MTITQTCMPTRTPFAEYETTRVRYRQYVECRHSSGFTEEWSFLGLHADAALARKSLHRRLNARGYQVSASASGIAYTDRHGVRFTVSWHPVSSSREGFDGRR